MLCSKILCSAVIATDPKKPSTCHFQVHELIKNIDWYSEVIPALLKYNYHEFLDLTSEAVSELFSVLLIFKKNPVTGLTI